MVAFSQPPKAGEFRLVRFSPPFRKSPFFNCVTDCHHQPSASCSICIKGSDVNAEKFTELNCQVDIAQTMILINYHVADEDRLTGSLEARLVAINQFLDPSFRYTAQATMLDRPNVVARALSNVRAFNRVNKIAEDT
jgi:hypothetical protein